MVDAKDKWIVMQEDLFHGHKGRIIITTNERVAENQPPIAKDIVDEVTAHPICKHFNEQNEYTKGEAVAEAWMPGSEADPRWVVKVNNEICFVTSCDDEANAKEFVRRWNGFQDEQED